MLLSPNPTSEQIERIKRMDDIEEITLFSFLARIYDCYTNLKIKKGIKDSNDNNLDNRDILEVHFYKIKNVAIKIIENIHERIEKLKIENEKQQKISECVKEYLLSVKIGTEVSINTKSLLKNINSIMKTQNQQTDDVLSTRMLFDVDWLTSLYENMPMIFIRFINAGLLPNIIAKLLQQSQISADRFEILDQAVATKEYNEIFGLNDILKVSALYSFNHIKQRGTLLINVQNQSLVYLKMVRFEIETVDYVVNGPSIKTIESFAPHSTRLLSFYLSEPHDCDRTIEISYQIDDELNLTSENEVFSYSNKDINFNNTPSRPTEKIKINKDSSIYSIDPSHLSPVIIKYLIPLLPEQTQIRLSDQPKLNALFKSHSLPSQDFQLQPLHPSFSLQERQLQRRVLLFSAPSSLTLLSNSGECT